VLAPGAAATTASICIHQHFGVGDGIEPRPKLGSLQSVVCNPDEEQSATWMVVASAGTMSHFSALRRAGSNGRCNTSLVA
jgi:hypothetical protein